MRLAALAGLLIACLGCREEAPAASTPTGSPPAATPAATSAPEAPGASYADSDAPVPEDYEAEAEKEITAENYKTRLSELESAIDGDG